MYADLSKNWGVIPRRLSCGQVRHSVLKLEKACFELTNRKTYKDAKDETQTGRKIDDIGVHPEFLDQPAIKRRFSTLDDRCVATIKIIENSPLSIFSPCLGSGLTTTTDALNTPGSTLKDANLDTLVKLSP